MSSSTTIASSFIDGAPPGELSNVVDDIKTLTSDLDPGLITKLKPAFQKYHEEQMTVVKLPGGSQNILISQYNRLSDGRYFDTASNTSFEFDSVTSQPSSPQSYSHSNQHADTISSILKSLTPYFSEHYTSTASSPSACTVVPSADSIMILIAANRYSPTNYWNGRWRSTYHFTPSSSSLTGRIAVDVHYYEDGNVALKTNKKVSSSNLSSSSNGADVVREIGRIERGYQEELNRAFVSLSEGSFKGLRRQLPVTRQKMEWEKVGGYRLGSDLRGGGR